MVANHGARIDGSETTGAGARDLSVQYGVASRLFMKPAAVRRSRTFNGKAGKEGKLNCTLYKKQGLCLKAGQFIIYKGNGRYRSERRGTDPKKEMAILVCQGWLGDHTTG